MLVENELKKLEKFNAAYIRDKNYFDGDGARNYLVFQGVYKHFDQTSNFVTSWKSKGLSDRKICHNGGLASLPKLIYEMPE